MDTLVLSAQNQNPVAKVAGLGEEVGAANRAALLSKVLRHSGFADVVGMWSVADPARRVARAVVAASRMVVSSAAMMAAV